MFASKDVFLKSTGAYTIARSVRLRSSASAYLNRTFASAGNQQKFTYSVWAKRGTLGGTASIASSGWSGSGATQGGGEFTFTSDQLNFDQQTNNGYDWRLLTNQVFRDPSSWYHIVIAVDTTQATASNRILMYVNGVQITSFSSATYPTLNSNTKFNATNQRIGTIDNGGSPYLYYDGYLAEVNFIDGQALTPSSFGAISTNGVWQPTRYTGTYGTNGFYLKFADNSTAAALGTDSSGNSNTWTVNNISVTAGTTYDSMTDVPTLTSATAANYPTWNPLQQVGLATFTEANLKAVSTSASAPNNIVATMAMPTTGKWYCEVTAICGAASPMIGIAHINILGGYAAYRTTGVYVNSIAGASSSGTPSTYTTNDVIGIAYDADAGTLNFYKNGVAQSGGFTAISSALGPYTFMVRKDSASGDGGYLNCGQRPFAYTAPTGFVALNTYNLSTPTIANGAAYMAATLYTGNNSTLAVTNTVNGVSFQPDFAWIKSRSAATSHSWMDVLRGYTGPQTSYPRLSSDLTAAELNNGGITAFNSTGFNLNNDAAIVNTNAATYVAWQWKAGGTGSSNTSGSITSTVSAGTTQGFSVVTYTGTGAAGTVGHGLGVIPSMIIAKRRSAIGSWPIYHTSLGNATGMFLNVTNAANSQPNLWNSTTPTSSVFTVGTDVETNASATTLVAYCFAAVAGYSAFGSYTGNGSADGPFVYLGFRPRWVMVKRTDATSDWYIWDTTRDTYNVATATLLADTSGAETSATSIDDLSNGFKCRSATVVNVSTGTYIYACFAENPFKYSLAR